MARDRSNQTSYLLWRVLPLGWVCSIAVVMSGCHVAATGHNLEGRRLFEQGQYNSAISSFQKAIKDDSLNSDAYYNLGAVYHHLGAESGSHEYLAQAEQYYRRSLELNPEHVDGYRALAVLYAQAGQQESAFNLIESWAMRSPQSAEPQVELARLYKEFGDSERARNHLVAALDRDAGNNRALRALGQLKEEQGNYVEALSMYEYALRQNNMQSDLSQRVAQLRQSINASGAPFNNQTSPNTRMVDAGTGPIRY